MEVSKELEEKVKQLAKKGKVSKTHQIAVRKEDFTFNLIRMPESHYLKTLRQKIKWGDDLRN